MTKHVTDPIVMIVKVPHSASQDEGDEALYEAARKWWRAALPQAERAERVLAVRGKVVVEAYEPTGWVAGNTPETDGRVAFVGGVSDDRDDWVGRDVSHLFPKGAANPVRYTTISTLLGPTAEPGDLTTATTPGSGDLVLLLRLNQSWSSDLTPEELYDVARMWWVISLSKAERVVRVLACANGEVKEVYTPHEWIPSPHAGEENRIGFEGSVAEDRDRYVGRDVSGLFRPGSANPVRYLPTDALDETLTDRRPTSDAAGRPLRVLSADAATENDGAPDLLELVAPLLEAFDRDLLWEMSRSAQDLFHSNTIAWLIQRHPETLRPVVELLGGEGYDDLRSVETWREHKSLDILLDAGDAGPRVVVENKHYSVPYAEQLEKYLAKPLPWTSTDQKPATAYVLLSLMDPAFRLPEPWRHVSYRDLGVALDQVHTDALGQDAPLADRYRTLVHRLVALHDAVDPLQTLDDPFSLRPMLKKLSIKRFDAPLQKMRFNGLAQAVATAYGSALDLSVGLSHSQGLIDFFHRPESGPAVGWQFQEDTLRLVVLVDEPSLCGKGKELAAARAAWVERNHLAWFDWGTAEEVLEDRLEPRQFKSGEWNHFAPDFVYRGRKVKQETTTAELADALAAISHDAKRWTW